jgi:UDP-N-acetylglucosamine transferase subunit ALG13
VWQLGSTDRNDLPGKVYTDLKADEFTRLIRECDVVVTHAGVGTAMHILDQGKCPVLVPRRKEKGEHVDDHQTQIARELSRRGVAVTADAGELTFEHLLAATALAVEAGEPDRT